MYQVKGPHPGTALYKGRLCGPCTTITVKTAVAQEWQNKISSTFAKGNLLLIKHTELYLFFNVFENANNAGPYKHAQYKL